MKKILLSLLAVFVGISANALTFKVTVSPGQETCYIAGNFNGWTLTAMTKVVGEDAFTIDYPAASEAGIEYKYCITDQWNTQEFDGNRYAYSTNDVFGQKPEVFLFHYGTEGQNDWKVIAFADAEDAEAPAKMVASFTLPGNFAGLSCYVDKGTWDNDKSEIASLNNLATAAGAVAGDLVTAVIYSDSNDKNWFLSLEKQITQNVFVFHYGTDQAEDWQTIEFVSAGDPEAPTKYVALFTIPSGFEALSCYVDQGTWNPDKSELVSMEGLVTAVNAAEGDMVEVVIYSDSGDKNWYMSFVKESSSDAFIFHYGTDGQEDWQTIEFINAGDPAIPNKYVALFTIPSGFETLSCYVDQGTWNPDKSELVSMEGLVTAANAAEGDMVEVVIYSDSGDKNWYMSFVKESSSDAFIFHYGTDGQEDWQTIEFINAGDPEVSSKYIVLFTIPSGFETLSCYVDQGTWNPDKSELVSMEGLATAAGAGVGDMIEVVIYSDSGDKNWYMSFVKQVPSSIDSGLNDAVKVYSEQSLICAEFEGQAQIKVYTINGSLIDQTYATGTYRSNNLSTGSYIIQINENAFKVAVK